MAEQTGVRVESFLHCLDTHLNILVVVAVYESQQEREGDSFKRHAQIFHVSDAVVEILGLPLLLLAVCKNVRKTCHSVETGRLELKHVVL